MLATLLVLPSWPVSPRSSPQNVYRCYKKLTICITFILYSKYIYFHPRRRLSRRVTSTSGRFNERCTTKGVPPFPKSSRALLRRSRSAREEQTWLFRHQSYPFLSSFFAIVRNLSSRCSRHRFLFLYSFRLSTAPPPPVRLGSHKGPVFVASSFIFCFCPLLFTPRLHLFGRCWPNVEFALVGCT